MAYSALYKPEMPLCLVFAVHTPNALYDYFPALSFPLSARAPSSFTVLHVPPSSCYFSHAAVAAAASYSAAAAHGHDDNDIDDLDDKSLVLPSNLTPSTAGDRARAGARTFGRGHRLPLSPPPPSIPPPSVPH